MTKEKLILIPSLQLEKEFMFQKLESSTTSDAPAELNYREMNHQKRLMKKTLQKSFFFCQSERQREKLYSQKARGQKTKKCAFLYVQHFDG